MPPENNLAYLRGVETASKTFLSAFAALPDWQRRSVYKLMGVRASTALQSLACVHVEHHRRNSPARKAKV